MELEFNERERERYSNLKGAAEGQVMHGLSTDPRSKLGSLSKYGRKAFKDN